MGIPNQPPQPSRDGSFAALAKPLAKSTEAWRGWCAAVVVLGMLFASGQLHAGDWPQVLGPDRNGHAVDESLRGWESDPTIRWRHRCGAGYAGVAVAQGNVFLWHRQGDDEVLECLDRTDGQIRWTRSFPAIYTGGVDPDRGPRCVPVVAGDRVLVYGAAGDLHAVRVSDGGLMWTRELRTELGASDGYFGAGSTPLVLDDRVIVEVGGRDDAALVALRLGDGSTLWSCGDGDASYASPVTVQWKGRTQIVAPLRLETIVVDPSNGKIQWQMDFGRRGPSVVAATPLIDGTRLFLTASYGVGCRLVDLDDAAPRHLWDQTDVVSSQYATPIKVGNELLAITGREDFNNAGLVSVNWKDGSQRWARPDYGTAHLIAVGDRVLAQHVDGRIDLIETGSEQYQREATYELPEGTYRSLPAFSQGELFCRRTKTATSGELIVLKLSAP